MVNHCHPLQLVHEVQLQCVELLETIFSVNTYLDKGSCRSEAVIEISRRLLAVQSELSLSYIPEISSVVLSLFLTLVQAEFEHKQLSILRMLLLLFKWKGEKGMFGIVQEGCFHLKRIEQGRNEMKNYDKIRRKKGCKGE